MNAKDTLWIKWVNTYYLKKKNIWLWKTGNGDPPLFKKLEQIRNLLLARTGSISITTNLLYSWMQNGVISTAMAYDWIRDKNQGKAWMSIIWRNYIPPKYSFILWLSMRGRLYTKNRWAGNSDRQCSFCKSALETLDHLFFHCTFVSAVWAKIRCWLGINREMSDQLWLV